MPYSAQSQYGKLQTRLDGTECICKARKPSGKPFCLSCYNELRDNYKSEHNGLTFARAGEHQLEAYLDAIEALGYSL